MSKQGVPYMPHSETSQEAAKLIEPCVVGDRRRVLDLLQHRADCSRHWVQQSLMMSVPEWNMLCDGCTDEEMQLALKMNPSTQRPRRGELVGMGLVKDSGRTRRTRSGRRATVWVAT